MFPPETNHHKDLNWTFFYSFRGIYVFFYLLFLLRLNLTKQSNAMLEYP
jgi:hypothetical protein